MITPPTFPARPLSGGDLTKNPIRPPGRWAFTPKLNGWRTLVHIPTGTMFNRHGERLSIASEFKAALELLYVATAKEIHPYRFADCEALDRRHGVGRGCLVVLDVVPEPVRYLFTEPDHAAASWKTRRDWIDPLLSELDLSPATPFPKLSLIPEIYGSADVWRDLQSVNKSCGCELWEGMVAWREDAPYPIQLRNSSEESAALIKYRWNWK